MLIRELIEALEKVEKIMAKEHKVVYREHCLRIMDDKSVYGVKSVEVYTYDDGCVIEVNKVYKSEELC